jgi:hypothetical protein
MKMLINHFLRIKKSIFENKRISLAIVVALISIFKIHLDYVESFGFFGIADTKEINISSSYAVNIKNIHVISGQKIAKNQLLIELDHPELEMKIYELKNQLDEAMGELHFNQKMNENLTSVTVDNTSDENSPLVMKVNNLKEQLKILEKEKNELYVFAQDEGVIGAVNVKVGEKISPFTPILTMHRHSPSMVRGYIHEQIFNKTVEGQSVIVSSIADNTKKVKAIVASVGSRIIEFPERLLKSDKIQTWGREVTIMLPEVNPFLVGEKVYIETSQITTNSSFLATANDNIWLESKTEIYHLEGKGSFVNDNIEPSGLVYLSDINKTLIVSDDTGPNKEPFIYLMGEKGIVEKEIMIEGMDPMADMESVTMDENGNIFIASSLSNNKNDKLKNERKKFIMLKHNKMKFELLKEMNLYDLLNDFANENKKTEFSNLFLKNKNLDIDVEAIIVQNNKLYLGFRNVTRSGEVVILRIHSVDKLFDVRKLNLSQIEVFARFSLPKDKVLSDEGISEMAFIKGNLYLLTATSAGMGGGRIFKTNLEAPSRYLSQVKRFEKLKPEGITYNSKSKQFIVSFDQGEKQSKILITNQL